MASNGLVLPTKIEGKKTEKGEAKVEHQLGAADQTNTIFIECFAGKGDLSRAVRRLGIPIEQPQDANNGGTDFGDDGQVTVL